MNNTGNPIGSSNPLDREDNSKVFDRLMLEDVAEVPDRLGRPTKTVASFQLFANNVEAVASQAAQDINEEITGLQGEIDTRLNNILVAGGRIFDTEADGRAAVQDGQYYYSASNDPNVTKSLYQRISSSVSQFIADDPSSAFVEHIDLQQSLAEVLITETIANTSPSFYLPPYFLGQRLLQIEALSFDLKPVSGRWLDTGEPWLYDGSLDMVFPITKSDGFFVEQWSFDLKPIFGYEQASGQPLPRPYSQNVISELHVVSENRLNLYTSQGGGSYIQWELTRDIVPERNADVWRIGASYHVSRLGAGVYSTIREITFNGETDVAIGIAGKAESIGGRIHGNEELEAFNILLDGVEIDLPSNLGLVTTFEKVEVLQKSQMFEVGSTNETRWSPKGQVIMEHFKRLVFTRGEWEQFSRIEHIVGGFTVSRGRFCMLCLSGGFEGVSSYHTGARYPTWEIEDLSIDFTELNTDSKIVKAWGDNYSAEIELLEGWEDPSRYIYFANTAATRKIYPVWYANVVTDTQVPWQLRSRFSVGIK
ncbi:hypothetical protein [Vreelandella titanicae]|uniref:hypothetical protein n=1 Tax=Vreelandella titanicae TaxID=664683 RepID=UPI0039BEDDD4